ncbi:Single-stranded DNA-binding protein [hydrothermal vent metagenome]|uniref:Single-stranded DNA-binding protein n=1 Tax=hydrothermal vent metagenome TaxID=652676 RepID=A0A3B0SEC1_9ZZZZ
MSNNVTIIGNLTADPELRFTASGVAMVNLSVADSRRYQDRNGEWQEETSFFRGTCWRDLAENVAESLTKGARVIISGRMKQRTWETNEGEKRNVVEIDIQEIGPSLRWATASVTKTPRNTDFAGGSGGSGGSGGGYGGGGAAPAAPVARTDTGPDEAPF